MFTRQGMAASAGKCVVLATIASLGLASISPSIAAPAAAKATSARTAASGATDFSAARRHRHYHGNGRAAAAFMGAAIGIIGGAIAAEQRRDYYENYGYYGGPGYYYGRPPGYYYGNPYYPY
jgi:hypothetical protein